MKKVLLRFISFICVFAMLSTMMVSASATDVSQNQAEEQNEDFNVISSPSTRNYTESNQYNITLPNNNDINSISTNNFDYSAMLTILNDAAIIYEDSSEGIISYDLSVANNFSIPNVKEVIEVSLINGTITFSYYDTNDKYIITSILPDSTRNTCVREAEKSDSLPSEKKVIEYNGTDNSVTEFTLASTGSANNLQAAATTTQTFKYPSPVKTGNARDTGSSGSVDATASKLISAAKKNMSIRTVYVQTNFRLEKTNLLTFTAGKTVNAIADALGFAAGGLSLALAAADITLQVVDGLKTIKYNLKIPEYPDYICLEGKYGDIYDTVTYNKWYRVYYDTGTTKYVSGLNANGSFTYLKRPWAPQKSSSTIIDKVQYLFNACIAVDGYNSMYDPV